MSKSNIKVPATGEKITYKNNKLVVPDNPIIPYIEGDGIGVDITPVMLNVIDAAVEKAYDGKRKISWMEIYCGEKSVKIYGDDEWLPDETLQTCKDYKVSIKGPLTTPVGGGIRSLNVAIRQKLDLYVCLRPVKYFKGTPSPVRRPDLVDMVIFRENSEDIYAGVEFESNTDAANKLIKVLQDDFGVEKIRFTENCGIGIKPVSEEGTKRLVRKAYEYAIQNEKDSVTLIHKGNIQKFTEGALDRATEFIIHRSSLKLEKKSGVTQCRLTTKSEFEKIHADYSKRHKEDKQQAEEELKERIKKNKI